MRSFVFGCLISTTLLACSSSNNNGPVCGDGVIEGNEACDDGAANGTSGSTCSSTCTVVAQAFCGDGHVDAGEQCDLGASNGTAGADCSATCTVQGYITASWAVTCVTGDTACTPGCPTGFDTAQLVSQEVDSTGTAIGAPKIDLFNCADGTGKSAVLKPGLYQEYIAITDHAGTTTYAQSLLKDMDITTADGMFMENIYIDGGYFHVSWTLKGVVSQTTLTCTQAGVSGAEVVSTVSGSANGTSDIFTCDDGQGTTGILIADNYVVSFDAVDAAQPPNGLGPATLVTATMLAQNQVVVIPTATIMVDGK